MIITVDINTMPIDNKKISEEIAKVESEVGVIRETVFKNTLSELLAELPEIKEILLTAYTPGYCDGEECLFSKRIYVNGYDADGYDEELNNIKKAVVGIELPKHQKLVKTVRDIMDLFPDSFYSSFFGASFKAKITPSEITIVAYKYEY